MSSTPKADGFRMPGEHEPQEAVVMVWPERADNWRSNAGPAQRAFVDVAVAISQATPLVMYASQAQTAIARSMLPSHIEVHTLENDDSWMRDSGPSFLVDGQGERRGVDWIFNAWGGEEGGLYWPWDKDDAVAERVLSDFEAPRYRAPIVLEGGAIHVDGEGTLITTEECLLNPNRNPELSRGQIETVLSDYLGIDKVIWIPRGVYNDETDGHVDNLLHIARPGVVLLTWCDDKFDPMYEICREAEAVLKSTPDARGRQINVCRIPMPGPLFYTEEEANGIDKTDGMVREPGERLAGSYANFLITNKHIVYPLLDEQTDEQAKVALQDAFPGYTLVAVPGREILLGGGNIHCITQQVPRLFKAES